LTSEIESRVNQPRDRESLPAPAFVSWIQTIPRSVVPPHQTKLESPVMIDQSPARPKRSAQIVDQIARFFHAAGISKITMNHPKCQHTVVRARPRKSYQPTSQQKANHATSTDR
jgi:hypothetical protein